QTCRPLVVYSTAAPFHVESSFAVSSGAHRDRLSCACTFISKGAILAGVGDGESLRRRLAGNHPMVALHDGAARSESRWIFFPGLCPIAIPTGCASGTGATAHATAAGPGCPGLDRAAAERRSAPG